MKYGASLRQHSIPQWSHHNIDYDDIKTFIKENTTPGQGKSISIPGAGDVRGKELEDNLYAILQQQHERITLFVRSKAGEIERRLSHLRKQTAQLASKPAGDGRIPAKRLERYGRLETDVLKAGEELRCLSRFCSAQQTAFRKLLKKYKKWTGSTDLQADFNRDVLDRPSSFTNLDLDPLLAEWEETLSELRTLYQDRVSARTQTPSDLQADSTGTRAQLRRVLESDSPIDFDSFFATLPLGRAGKNAVYWVHPDNVVELQVLLVQHSRTHGSRRHSLPVSSPVMSRNNSCPSLSGRRRSLAHDPDTGVLIADDIDSFVARQSSSTFEKMESSPGVILQTAAVHARWTKEEDAQITARVNDGEIQKAVVKRKHIAAALDVCAQMPARKASNLDDLRKWLSRHEKVKPLAAVTSNRSRFVNASESGGFLLATLDKGVAMRQGIPATTPVEDLFTADVDAEFPFAVLRVRQEGSHESELIKILDQSHLVERVRGFSLEYHALWYCCQPENVVPPFWIPLMHKDIRKLPTAVSRTRANRFGSSFGSQSTTPQLSTSNPSVEDRVGDMIALGDISPGRITIPDQLQTPPLSAFRKKRKSPYERIDPVTPKQKYWSEYDNPSDSDDDGAYVLYIDPNEESTATKTWRSLRDFLTGQRKTGHEPLLGSDGTIEAGLTEDTLTSSDEEGQPTRKRVSRRSYGALGGDAYQVAQPGSPQTHHGDWVPQLTIACLVASVLLLCVGYILVATGRRKLASEVDAGIVLVVASSLAFAVSGVGVTFGRRPLGSMLAWLAVGVLIADAAAASTLIVWAFG